MLFGTAKPDILDYIYCVQVLLDLIKIIFKFDNSLRHNQIV